MRQLKYSQSAALDVSKALTRLQLPAVVKNLKPIDVACVLLPLCAFILWSISLKSVDVQRMNDLGLVSVLSPSIIIALFILMISYCLSLREMRVPILLLHLVLLVFMLYGITTLVEAVPNFSVVYRHAGYTEYIMRTGTVKPNLDTYFNWPGFFILSAFLTRVAGYQTVLSFAAWASVFFNLIFLGPLYMIFTSATTNKRLVWLGLWFFPLTNWIEQDSFLPQALNFFLYLVIIAILLKWFKAQPKPRVFRRKSVGQHSGYFSLFRERLHGLFTEPDMLCAPSSPLQRAALLVILISIFGLSVSSHPLTPFFVIASVSALVIFRRCKLFWLPILMVIMNVAWILIMAKAFLAGHAYMVTGDFFHIGSAISTNVTSRAAQGSPEHIFIAHIRIVMTLAVWGLAFLGAVRRLHRGQYDLTYILLAVAPFPLFLVQQYGGEILLRIYLFSLPFMVFFAASLFYTESTDDAPSQKHAWRLTVALAGMSIVLLVGFLFTRYGNERMDYFTNAEVDGVHYLYSIAPPNALLIEGWDGTPWMYENYEKYNTYSLTSVLYDTTDETAIKTNDISTIIQFINTQNPPATYLIFTRSQKAGADQAGMPPGTLDKLEQTLVASGKFKMIYSNPDAQIFEYFPLSKAYERKLLRSSRLI